MTYDLIMVAASKDDQLRKMTQQAINSCVREGVVNVILVETFRKTEYLHVDKHLMYTGEFNYNRALNMGLKEAKSDIQILANNDIIFLPGWSVIGDLMTANEYLSASALSGDMRQHGCRRGDFAYEGYDIGVHLTGWCIFAAKELWNKIGPLDETYTFWFSDNAYAAQLQKAGIKHALICSVVVNHLGSKTLMKERSNVRIQLTHAQRKRIS